MPAADHTLVVVRHAKAEPSGPTDFERPLADRGRDDAAAAGRWLAEQGVVPDVALVSAALRTRQTWEVLAAAAGWTVEPELDRGLYAADPETVVDVLRLQDEAAATVVVVGHNPTMASLAATLDDAEGDPAAGNAMAMDYPTGAVAVLDLDVPWADVGPATARVRAFHVGRG